MLKITLDKKTYTAKINGRVCMDVSDFQDFAYELSQSLSAGSYEGRPNSDMSMRATDLIVSVFGGAFTLDELLDLYDADENGGLGIIPYVNKLCSEVSGVTSPNAAPARPAGR